MDTPTQGTPPPRTLTDPLAREAYAAGFRAVADARVTTMQAPDAPWRALPDDLDLMATLRWLHAGCIPVEYRGRGDAVTLYAPLTDDEYWALLREVPPAPTEVGR